MKVTREELQKLSALADAATPGPWDVWREPTATPDDAKRELAEQVDKSEPFAEAVFLLNASGKCPATTGCGPSSGANAAFIAAANPAVIKALCDLALQALDMRAEREHLVDQLRKEGVEIEHKYQARTSSGGKVD